MKRRLLLLAAAAASAAALCGLRPYNQAARAKAVWMQVSSIKTGQGYYLEVGLDGQALMRTDSSKAIVTRRGSIKPQLVKDFFREIENSEIINSQNVKQSKMIFYRGDMIKISAYISGELTRTEAPLNNFGEAFSYAFTEVRKAAAALPVETGVQGFLRAEPVEGDALDAFRQKAAANGEVKTLETYDILKVPALMAAIKEPYRLVPLENEAAVKELRGFISARKLYGLRTLFYVPSTRGTFKCEVLEADRKAPAEPKAARAAKSKPKK